MSYALDKESSMDPSFGTSGEIAMLWLFGAQFGRTHMHRIVLLSAALLVSAAPALAAEPIGEWLVKDGVARIKIDNCGEGLWGVVAWEKEPGVDEHNPDPSKRARPTLGMPVLLDMKSTEPGRWDGEVYNAENGKTYSSHISLVSTDVLRVEGCVLGILCGGENWTRFKAAPEAPPKGRTQPPAAVVDVCLSVTRATGTPHERRLK
jgi:uncharacterized protein (DUF2147 family)